MFMGLRDCSSHCRDPFSLQLAWGNHNSPMQGYFASPLRSRVNRVTALRSWLSAMSSLLAL